MHLKIFIYFVFAYGFIFECYLFREDFNKEKLSERLFSIVFFLLTISANILFLIISLLIDSALFIWIPGAMLLLIQSFRYYEEFFIDHQPDGQDGMLYLFLWGIYLAVLALGYLISWITFLFTK